MEKVLKLSLAILIFLSFSCIAKENAKKIGFIQSEEGISKKKRDYFLCMTAYYEYLNGDVSKALSSFKKLLSNKNVPFYAYEGYIKLLFDLNQFQEIIKLKDDKLKDEFKDSMEMQIIFALSYLNLNLSEKADKIFSYLLKKYPDDEQVAYYAIVADIKNNNLEKALQFIAQSVERPAFKSKHFIFHFLESKIYLQMGDAKKALISINKSLEKYANFGKGWLLKALLEEQLGRVNEAIKGYKNFLSIVGHDLAVEKQLVSLLFKSSRFREAADVLKKIDSDSPQYFFDLALIEWKSEDYDSALQSINKSIEKLPDFKKAKMLKVEILLAKNQKQEALDFLKNWLQSAPQDDSVIHLLLLLKKVDIKKSQIIAVFEKVLQEAQDSVGIWAVLADLYLEETNYEKVIFCCNKLLDLSKDEAFKSKLLFQMAYVYFVTNQQDKVEPTLREAMQYKPVYSSVYNLLAYFYAKNEKNLNEALELCDQALKSDPNCYYYLDTKGYVLLKLGDMKRAVEFLEKALTLSQINTGRQDAVILDHLKVAKAVKV